MSRSNRQIRRPSLAMIGLGIATLVVLVGCGEITDSISSDDPDAVASRIEDEWGVKVLGIRRTAAGYMLDFRYRVLDAEKAAPILDRRITPYLKVAATGVTLLVPQAPKLGSMRQTSFAVKPDRNYFIVFANPSQTVSVGDEVSIVIGDFQTQTLTVQ
jgi:hypothetical protein